MTIDHPLRLVVLLIIALALLAGVVMLLRSRARATHAYSNLDFLASVAAAPKWIERTLAATAALGVLVLATAFSGPHLRIPMPVLDGSVVLCIDTSGSMASTDISPTRFAAAQQAARAFITATAPGTRIGIVAFSGAAGLIAPLQSDHAAVANALDTLPPPNGGTAIGDALALAANALPAKGHRVIVLITDGVNNAGIDPLGEAQQLGARGVKIYTIGIGTQNGDLIPGTDQSAGLDEGALNSYAQATGGAYARAGSASALRAALAHLGQVTGFEQRKVDASFGFAAFGGIAIFAAAIAALALGRLP